LGVTYRSVANRVTPPRQCRVESPKPILVNGLLPLSRPSGRDGRQETEKIVCRHSLDRLNASMIKPKKKIVSKTITSFEDINLSPKNPRT